MRTAPLRVATTMGVRRDALSVAGTLSIVTSPLLYPAAGQHENDLAAITAADSERILCPVFTPIALYGAVIGLESSRALVDVRSIPGIAKAFAVVPSCHAHGRS